MRSDVDIAIAALKRCGESGPADILVTAEMAARWARREVIAELRKWAVGNDSDVFGFEYIDVDSFVAKLKELA